MTEKYLKMIAAALNRSKPVKAEEGENMWHSEGRLEQWTKDVQAMAAMCAASNPRFKASLFYKACGV